jgi:16S rRNA (cytosine967-C5)-methyltransferase
LILKVLIMSNSAKGLASRLCAQRLLGAVIDTKTPLDGLTDDVHGHPQYLVLDARDRSLVRAILSSALRFRGTIEAFLASLIEKPLPENAKSLHHLLHVASSQILFLDVPDHSAVDLAVEAARSDPRNARFASLVNAVLRRLVREKSPKLSGFLTVSNLPKWLYDELTSAYGSVKTAQIMEMMLKQAPLDFSVKSDPSYWAEELGGVAIPHSFTVRVGAIEGSVSQLPRFTEGEWWVQDVAATMPVRCLGDVAGKHVLDVCAAPGGKTALLAHAGAHVTALDVSHSRMKRLKLNMERLKLDVKTHVSSVFDYQPPQLFDAVLLDAPCSSTGTMRRHPDVAWTKTPQDVAKLADLQFKMMNHAAQFVKSGGVLVFSNCSLLPIEGEDMVTRLLFENDRLRLAPLAPPHFTGFEHLISPQGWLRSTPADLPLLDKALSGMDGFFAACFVKI